MLQVPEHFFRRGHGAALFLAILPGLVAELVERSELKKIVLQHCQGSGDEVYQRRMKYCGHPTADSIPGNLKVPFTGMRLRVMAAVIEGNDDCWQAKWDDVEERDGVFESLIPTAV